MITWAILAAVFLCAKGEVQPVVVVAPVVSNVTEQETVTLGYGNQSSVTSEQRGFRTDWSKPFFCPKERYSLSITCGQKDVNYMSQLERDAMRQNDLTDPTRCGRFRFDNINEVDFIVIGSGAAGAVVAGRLAENPNWSVMVLEAGDSAPVGSNFPSMYFNYLGDPNVDWSYHLVTQDNACLRTGGTCTYPRGKAVGGTTVLHGMMYMRGNPEDYNSLAEDGIEGWNYEDVLPYFLISEDNPDLDTSGSPIESDYHARGGPLTVSYFKDHPSMAENLLDAYKEMGYNTNIDFNGKSQNGFSLAQATTRNGARETTAKAYLYPQLDNGNLYVLPKTRVLKVVINPSTLTAEGVEVERYGVRRVIKAKKEVILSAGAIESPHILMTSGIGDRAHLEEVGVSVVKNRPGVGQNLKNHVSTELFFKVNSDRNNTQYLNNITTRDFFSSRTGPLTSTGLSQLTGFIWTKYEKGSESPDVQIFHAGYMANCSATGSPSEKVGPGVRVFSVSPTVLHAKSSGEVRLRNVFPDSDPLIYGGILTEDADVQRLLAGIRFAQNITTTDAMKNLKVEMDKTPAQGCEEEEFDSDSYWRCYMAHNTNPENHQVGTCRMGSTDDQMAVVDSQLKVIGIKNLRVADASVFPRTPSGNLQAPTIMVGERAAAFLKDTWA